MSFEISNSKSSVSRRNKQRGSKKLTSSLKSNALADHNMANMNRFHGGNHQSYIPNFNISGSCSYSVPFPCIQEGPMSLPAYPVMHPPPGANYVQYNNAGSYNYSNPNSLVPNEPNEYMSLPVVHTDGNENASDRRRFSDPGLPCDSDSSSQSHESRMIKKLIQEVEVLKENNRKLTGEVMELKMEVNMLKQQQSVRYGDREYEPGMLADVIKEIRDAARVREDALLSKVKHMIEEKQLSMTHLHMASEKNRHNERLAKLEEQMKNLSTSSGREDSPLSDDGPNSARQVLELEREALTLRRELQEARAKKEESDQKLIQLDKKLAALLHQKEFVSSIISDDRKGSSSCTDLISLGSPYLPQRVTLTGPVTDL